MPDNFRQARIGAGTPRRGVAVALAAVLAWAAVWSAAAANSATVGACDVPAVVKRALPAVVNILSVRLLRKDGKPSGIEFFVGTGVIIDPSGVIVTNQHVIQDAVVVRVTFPDKTQTAAYLIGAASLTDLALLKVDVAKPLPVLSFADSDKLEIGQPVIAVGNPLGIGTSISTGSVSAVNRDLMRSPFDDYIQTDATINPGNSGGPLLDCNGNVVGIDTALISSSKIHRSIGLGFALPADTVKFVAKKLQTPGAMPDWIGVHLQDMNARLAATFKQQGVLGAIVTGVDPNSPAARASLAPGDVVTAVSGEDLPDARAVQRAILMVEPGTPITLAVSHLGQQKNISVTGEPWPNFKKLQSQVIPSEADFAQALTYGLGLHVVSIDAADRKRFDLGNIQGVLIDRVDPDTQADGNGFELGDVIEQIGDKPATSPVQVMTDLTYGKPDSDDMVAVLVHQKSGTQWFSLWVGRADSREFVNRESGPEGNAIVLKGPEGTAQNASAKQSAKQ